MNYITNRIIVSTIVSLILTAITGLLSSPLVLASDESLKIAVGKMIFNDTNLSEPAGQSCNSCHQADAFHSDPGKIVSPGANPTLFGNRNAPAISYVKFNPALYWDKEEQHWVGGFFLDGREKTLRDQSTQPFFNPVEMGNPTPATLIAKVRKAAYADTITQLYGESVWDNENNAISAIADAIARYESGPEFATFSSKYDLYLQGKLNLSPLEHKGMQLFEAEDKGNCAACHPNHIGENGELPLFTDFTYDNLGLPVNKKLPFLNMPKQHNPKGKNYIDYGLSENSLINNGPDEKGKFKVSTLRNIANTAPYMHNGVFNTLKEVMDFYNSRDIDKKWGKPEVQQNVNDEELGDLKLTDDEIEAIIAFMKTLSDGYQMPR